METQNICQGFSFTINLAAGHLMKRRTHGTTEVDFQELVGGRFITEQEKHFRLGLLGKR